jgi:hypothetical protein
MNNAIPAALGAAIALAAGGATAQAETVRYRVTYAVAGTWSESMRANPDRSPQPLVASRDTDLRWSLAATFGDIAFRDGRTGPVDAVAGTRMAQEVLGSSFTGFDGEAGACRADTAVATGAGAIAPAGRVLVLRPSSDALLDLQCAAGELRHAVTLDLLRNAGAGDVPALGQGPLDAAFAFPAGRFGAARVTVPVAASAGQRAFDRCPRQEPWHTAACGFDWRGEVVLERLSPRIGAARAVRDGRGASEPVTCFEPCTVTVRAGGAARTFRLQAGAARTLRLRLDPRTRKVLARGDTVRVRVRAGAERRTLRVG